jgi:hypothetical protein
MDQHLIKDRKVHRAVVDEFNTVLEDAEDEKPIQHFLAQHRELLTVLCPNSPNIWIIDRPRLGSEYIPDFLICHRNSSGYQWILIEIESPLKKPLNKNGRPASKLTEALSQISDWRIWIRDNISYCREQLGLKGIDAEAKGIAIIGRRNQLDLKYAKQYREMSNGSTEVMTYDRLKDLLNSSR